MVCNMQAWCQALATAKRSSFGTVSQSSAASDLQRFMKQYPSLDVFGDLELDTSEAISS